jgi:alpha-galactosidase
VWERLTKLLNQHPVSFISWSPVVDDRRRGSARTRHASTLAAYRLLDALRERYPAMSMVSPALDLAMAKRSSGTDPAPDAATRHRNFAALVQLRPPGLIWQPAYDEPDEGASPGFRAISAFFGQLGLGLDLRKQAPASLRSIHRWLALYKDHRSLLHTGRTVRSDQSDRGFTAHGVVADDKAAALFAFTWLDRSGGRRVRLDGLDPTATYQLEVVGTRPTEALAITPAWSGSGQPLLMTGRMLETAGVLLPAARRGSALLLHLVADAQD